MPPKSTSANKTSSLLTLFRTSNTVFTLKELEKCAPGPTGISGMQLKDYIQALVDENLIRVEKIGSGNWYWSFGSEEKKQKENILDSLRKEKEGLETKVVKLRDEVRCREESEDEIRDHQEWQAKYDELKNNVRTLREELKGYEGNDPAAVEEKRKEIQQAKESAERWTDNVLLLESWFLELTGGDRTALEDIRRDMYGDEYVEGEGLREL